jgi:hypothetical protein
LYKAADILGFVSPAHATQDCIAATLYRDVKMHAKLGYLPGGPKQVFVEELRFNRGQPDQFDLINVGNSLDDIAETMPIIMIQAQIYTTQNNFFEALQGKKPGLGDYIFKPGRTAMPSGVWHSTIVTVEIATVLNLLEGTCMPEHVVHRAVSKSFSRHNIKKFAPISGEDLVDIEFALIIHDEINIAQRSNFFTRALSKTAGYDHFGFRILLLPAQGFADQIATLVVGSVCNCTGIDDIDICWFLNIYQFCIRKLGYYSG